SIPFIDCINPKNITQGVRNKSIVPTVVGSFGYNNCIIGVASEAIPNAHGKTINKVTFIALFVSFLALLLFPKAKASDIAGTKLILIATVITDGRFIIDIAIPVN